MTVSRHTLIQWTEEAKTSLNKASDLCQTAEVLISNLINKLVVELLENLDLIDDKHNQFKMVNNLIENYIIFLHDKVYNDGIGKYDTDYKRLTRVQQDFNQIIDQLDNVEVPSFLIQDMDHQALLKTFISLDEIEVLFDNINTHNDNMTKLHRFMDKSFRETVEEPFDKVINRRFQKFGKNYETLITSHRLNNELIQTILEENESLGQELVSLLQMLTNHYDQCLLGLNQFDNTDAESDINYEVLEQDALESVTVLKDLKSIYDIIINNEIRGKKILQTLESLVDKIKSQITDLDKMYNRFKSTNLFQIIIFLNKYHEMNQKLNLDNYHHIIDQLIYYYRNFLLVFKTKYLAEYHHQQFTYPKQFLDKLNKFLNEELYQFQQDERQRRVNWLNKYGEFIPKQFKLPGESQPSVVQVITEGLTEDDTSNVFKEKQLLDLIKSYK